MSAVISRATLQPEGAARYRHWLASGAYAEHQMLWQLFEGNGSAPFLYRWPSIEAPAFLVSPTPPTITHPAWRVESKEYAPRLVPGSRLAYALRANPTLERDGRRHDLVMDARSHGDHRGRLEIANDVGLAWLRRQGEKHGFEVDSCTITYYGQIRTRGISIGVMDFQGMLRVTDPAAFTATLVTGVGRAKRLGCGLLLVRRA